MDTTPLYCYGIKVDFFQIDEITEVYTYSFETEEQLIQSRNNSLIKALELLKEYPYINAFDFYLQKMFFVNECVLSTILTHQYHQADPPKLVYNGLTYSSSIN